MKTKKTKSRKEASRKMGDMTSIMYVGIDTGYSGKRPVILIPDTPYPSKSGRSIGWHPSAPHPTSHTFFGTQLILNPTFCTGVQSPGHITLRDTPINASNC